MRGAKRLLVNNYGTNCLHFPVGPKADLCKASDTLRILCPVGEYDRSDFSKESIGLYFWFDPSALAIFRDGDCCRFGDSLFAVVVFTYSRLITDRELVVMRSTGMSQTGLAKPALILAFVVTLIGYALNFYLLPQSYRMFRELQWDIRYNYSHILLQEGAFNAVSDGVTVYLRELTTDGQLLGILVHDNRKREKPWTIMASRGALMETEKGARVVMFDGNRQQLDLRVILGQQLVRDEILFDGCDMWICKWDGTLSKM